MEVTQRILHIDPDFLKRQQEAMIKARELEIQRMRQMQLSMPAEPGTAPQNAQGREIPVTINATPPPSFSGPTTQGPRPVQAPAAPPRPVHMPGAMPVRTAVPVAPQVPVDIKTIGRNDPCPCGSGKKFKKCHGEGR
jgi:hypothetical protein